MSEEYFKKYRQKLADAKQIQERMATVFNESKAEIERLYKNLKIVEQEYCAMRRIITKIIEDDLDDVEARLVTDEISIVETTLWQGAHNASAYPGPPSLHSAVGHLVDLSTFGVNNSTNYSIISAPITSVFGGGYAVVSTHNTLTDANEITSIVPNVNSATYKPIP